MYNVQVCFSGTVIKNTDQSLYCSVFIFLIIFNDRQKKKKRSLNYNLHMISRVKWIIIKYSTNQWFHQWFKRLYYLCIFLIFEIKIMSLNIKKKEKKTHWPKATRRGKGRFHIVVDLLLREVYLLAVRTPALQHYYGCWRQPRCSTPERWSNDIK